MISSTKILDGWSSPLSRSNLAISPAAGWSWIRPSSLDTEQDYVAHPATPRRRPRPRPDPHLASPVTSFFLRL
jgi:hypothetical protein